MNGNDALGNTIWLCDEAWQLQGTATRKPSSVIRFYRHTEFDDSQVFIKRKYIIIYMCINNGMVLLIFFGALFRNTLAKRLKMTLVLCWYHDSGLEPKIFHSFEMRNTNRIYFRINRSILSSRDKFSNLNPSVMCLVKANGTGSNFMFANRPVNGQGTSTA